MKFAKELEQELVPEWRAKYLDYKRGKKKIKAVSRALRNAQSPPRRLGRSTQQISQENAPQTVGIDRSARDARSHSNAAESLRAIRAQGSTRSGTSPVAIDGAQGRQRSKSKGSGAGYSAPLFRSRKNTSGSGRSRASGPEPEAQPLHEDFKAAHAQTESSNPRLTRYGSIVGTPPKASNLSLRGRGPPSLDLPGPALRMRPAKDQEYPNLPVGDPPLQKDQDNVDSRDFENADKCRNAYEAGETKHPSPRKGLNSHHRSIFRPRRVNTQSAGTGNIPVISRLLSFGAASNVGSASPGDIPMEALREVDVRQSEFFVFLDHELEKIESFYKLKEDDATDRLEALRQQLHIMRDRRIDELVKARKEAMNSHSKHTSADGFYENGARKLTVTSQTWLSKIDGALENAKRGKFGKGTKAMETMTTPHALEGQQPWNRDYVRRKPQHDVSYRAAKRKLKLAMQEFYRGLELLKSYALLNRKAFRKINKKYDKAVNARPSLRYMNEKVNTAYFVQSGVLDGHIKAVEDLYARYFEGGNYKVAAGKLRAKVANLADYTGTVFRNGLYVAGGLVFGVQGLVCGAQLLYDSDMELATTTSFLLQIYAGYFFMLLLTIFFVIDCRMWTRAKVNYAFIFEFDSRHVLDWRQLAEIPCLFLFLLGFTIWLNFTRYGTADMYIYYPALLVGTTALLLLNPLPIFYPRARHWFLYATWRLFFSGLYPVEFRDFFLGDMFCSQTYAMGNIELFFCLYVNSNPGGLFDSPAQCNSSHSRALGFFSTLPGIWRALQCVRRYRDTGNVFPHLVNCGKYVWTILFYVSLSLFRIHKTTQLKAFFILAATVNATYCSIWDLLMDWSLLDPSSRHPFLRDHLAFKSTWPYYLALILDPILRFNWIFYAIFASDLQHSTLVAFFVALSEILRRGIWVVFRVENEHCTNIARFRASRDVPLPYKIRKRTPSALGHGDEAAVLEVTAGDDEDDEEEEAKLEEQRRQGISLSPALSRGTRQGVESQQDARSSALDLHQTVTPTREGSSAQARRRRLLPDAEGQASGKTQPGTLARSLTRVGEILRVAHAQDFERKRTGGLTGAEEAGAGDEDDSDEEDDEIGDSGDGDEYADVADIAPSGQADGTEEERRRRRREVEELQENEMIPEEVAQPDSGSAIADAEDVGTGYLLQPRRTESRETREARQDRGKFGGNSRNSTGPAQESERQGEGEGKHGETF